MSIDTKDILLKAAEDVQQGMWCQGDWFRENETSTVSYTDDQLFNESLELEKATTYLRCAEGSIALATRLLGGTASDYHIAVLATNSKIPKCECDDAFIGLAHFNDDHLFDSDPFVSGQQLAELFRSTADSL